jgi:hypothetical protein
MFVPSLSWQNDRFGYTMAQNDMQSSYLPIAPSSRTDQCPAVPPLFNVMLHNIMLVVGMLYKIVFQHSLGSIYICISKPVSAKMIVIQAPIQRKTTVVVCLTYLLAVVVWVDRGPHIVKWLRDSRKVAHRLAHRDAAAATACGTENAPFRSTFVLSVLSLSW